MPSTTRALFSLDHDLHIRFTTVGPRATSRIPVSIRWRAMCTDLNASQAYGATESNDSEVGTAGASDTTPGTGPSPSWRVEDEQANVAHRPTSRTTLSMGLHSAQATLRTAQLFRVFSLLSPPLHASPTVTLSRRVSPALPEPG
ncbi:hypothetical protein MKEN_00397000 [Mycena kentingensis (nom. inval.)]|nr:hypothetical protein MKEN_00397000 [Mycena kentingensis (nom. inval.)]